MGWWEAGGGTNSSWSLWNQSQSEASSWHMLAYPLKQLEGNGAMVPWLLKLPFITESHDSYAQVSLSKASHHQAQLQRNRKVQPYHRYDEGWGDHLSREHH